MLVLSSAYAVSTCHSVRGTACTRSRISIIARFATTWIRSWSPIGCCSTRDGLRRRRVASFVASAFADALDAHVRAAGTCCAFVALRAGRYRPPCSAWGHTCPGSCRTTDRREYGRGRWHSSRCRSRNRRRQRAEVRRPSWRRPRLAITSRDAGTARRLFGRANPLIHPGRHAAAALAGFVL